MGVSIVSQKTLRSLSESHPSISTLLSHLSVSRSDPSRKPSENPLSDSFLTPLPLYFLSIGSFFYLSEGKVCSFRSSQSNPSIDGSSSWMCSESLGFSRRNRYSSSVLNPVTHGGCFRCYSASASAAGVPESRSSLAKVVRQKPKLIPFWNIVALVRNGDGDLDSELDSMNLSLDFKSAREILRVLNQDKVSALGFFDWLQDTHHGLMRNSCLCNLMIDNCGRCDDYETMRSLLVRFSSEGIALTKEAFQFLALRFRDEGVSVEEAIRTVVRILEEVKGGVYATGMQSLIEMLASSVSFDMAKLVIRLSNMRVSYYSTLIKEMCKKQEYQKARDAMGEMREAHQDYTIDFERHIYNYMISTMLKAGQEDSAHEALQEMMSKGCPPDALTFEIFICDCVAKERFSTGIKFFDHMVEAGIEPRQSTHAAVIKLLFNVEQYDEAYKYVVSVSDRFKNSGNQAYDTLAELHRRKSNLVTSKDILCAMMNKGLAPDPNIYGTVLRSLKSSRWKRQATDLENQYKRLQLAA
ncbi:unnamed protein product [Linum trigynum]|uniref:Pentatricopeptide repeat-containing protein n=1 Tax=Linum trigynum TaxID=586398 RepID=A0AAV2GHE6_9ROSI